MYSTFCPFSWIKLVKSWSWKTFLWQQSCPSQKWLQFHGYNCRAVMRRVNSRLIAVQSDPLFKSKRPVCGFLITTYDLQLNWLWSGCHQTDPQHPLRIHKIHMDAHVLNIKSFWWHLSISLFHNVLFVQVCILSQPFWCHQYKPLVYISQSTEGCHAENERSWSQSHLTVHLFFIFLFLHAGLFLSSQRIKDKSPEKTSSWYWWRTLFCQPLTYVLSGHSNSSHSAKETEEQNGIQIWVLSCF